MGLFKSLTKIGLLVVCCLLLGSALSPCLAADDSPWLFRARLLGIYPDASSSPITLIGGEADVEEAYTPDLDITYFFTDNIAAELVFFAYSRHDVEAKNTIVGDVDLGSLDLVPPILTAQYHFMPKNTFRPYVGAGLSFVLIPDEDPGDAVDVKYDDGVIGFALQAGFDYFFNDHWCLNVDVKKIWVDVDVEVNAGGGIIVETSVDVDPLVVGVGVGYRF
ncbi:MAG: OmpW family outer membrane protein [Desulfobacteraceae bacterium]|jgi:outer membrane protein